MSAYREDDERYHRHGPSTDAYDEERRAMRRLCAACTMPREDRHHSSDYVMHRVPWDIPRHDFVPQ